MRNIALFLMLGVAKLCLSNNITVSNVTFTGQDTVAHVIQVSFDLSWDNSWHTSTYESNYDAAWVFIKWQKPSVKIWNHATLNTSGHTAPAGSAIDTPPDGKGVFIHRNADGTGSNAWSGVILSWNYGADGLADSTTVQACVFALEMVYVPQAPFYLGDGTASNIRGQFGAGTTQTPFLVTSEASLTLGGGGAGSLGNNNGSGMEPTGPDDFNNATSKSLPAAYPKGYQAFYVMKYETTQEAYVEFLNRLTYNQQVTRTQHPPSSAIGTHALTNSGRNGIVIQTPGISNSTPAVYGCDGNGNGTCNEINDGQTIACNWMHFADCEAYLDWAALRPITELEYEKACRGTLNPVADEYAWGTNTITGATGLVNSDATTEEYSNAGAYCVYNNAVGVPGPMRVGNFAQAGSNRQSSGASYYGILDLSGNVREMVITVGNTTGRAFDGTPGDGVLAANGEANTANWPTGFTADASNAVGAGYKGYDWEQHANPSLLRVSDRDAANYPYKWRDADYGFRGGRTAP